jgi:glucose-fructose oxidoreductase
MAARNPTRRKRTAAAKGKARKPRKPAGRKAAAAAPGKARNGKVVRYAVVGLGHFAQAAVLPAFAHAKNSRITALISDDPAKLKALAKKYGVEKTYAYDGYQECLASRDVDAVYITLPNHLHREYAVRAARMGVHVLCEKPMAPTEEECEEMIREAREHDARLMIAYRLHFEAANLEAVEIANSGRIGEARLFQSAFTMQVKADNIRTNDPSAGGGPLFDIGVYCINAARYIFRSEPYEVYACAARKDEPRFRDIDEMVSAVLRFPGERLAVFTCSFGAADAAVYRVFGTRGDLQLEPAYEYALPIRRRLTAGGKSSVKTYPRRDQIAPEIVYFSDCVLKGAEPEPSGVEGLADVRVVRALRESIRAGRPVQLEPFVKRRRPGPGQAMAMPPAEEPQLVHVEGPTQG